MIKHLNGFNFIIVKQIAIIAIIAVLLLTGCTFFESLEREGFNENDLRTPLPIKPITIAHPIENFANPLSYQYNVSWVLGTLFPKYKGMLRISINNTGSHKLFVYGFSVEIDGNEQKSSLSSIGRYIEPGEMEHIIWTFTCPVAGNHTYRLGIQFLSGVDSKWHDYGLQYIEGVYTMDVEGPLSTSYTLKKNYYKYFDRINDLVDPFNPDITQQMEEITSFTGSAYSIATVCDICTWIYDTVEYVNESADDWRDPCTALTVGGDCEEFAMLCAAMITAAGGTSRVYLSDNHAFAAIYIGKNSTILDSIDAYFGTELSYALFNDEFGYWIVADPLASPYPGGLPVGGGATDGGGRYYHWSIFTNKLYSIDVLAK